MVEIFLGGGGDKRDSALLDAAFAARVQGQRILYLAIAMDGMSLTYSECRAWIHDVFNPLGVNDITMWESLDSRRHEELKSFDAIYVGGGNTFKLVWELRTTGFDRALADFAGNGAVYGGSAGAIIFGKDISTCAWTDSNDVGVIDTSGLGLIGGLFVWCHYQAWHDHAITEFAQPVLALSEKSGAIFDGVKVTVLGAEPAAVFLKGSKMTLSPGDSIELTKEFP